MVTYQPQAALLHLRWCHLTHNVMKGTQTQLCESQLFEVDTKHSRIDATQHLHVLVNPHGLQGTGSASSFFLPPLQHHLSNELVQTTAFKHMSTRQIATEWCKSCKCPCTALCMGKWKHGQAHHLSPVMGSITWRSMIQAPMTYEFSEFN